MAGDLLGLWLHVTEINSSYLWLVGSEGLRAVSKGILDTLYKMVATSPPLWVRRGVMRVFVS